jgi:hypothetical protein
VFEEGVDASMLLFKDTFVTYQHQHGMLSMLSARMKHILYHVSISKEIQGI